jgi:AcrR family transcriptional regulator
MSAFARLCGRNTEDPDVTPPVILEAAFTLVADKGLDHLQADLLAEWLGCDIRTVRDHFAGDEALAEAIVWEAVSRVPLPILHGDSTAWQDDLAALAAAMRATLLPLAGVARRVAEMISITPQRNVLVVYASTVLRLAGHRDSDWAAKLFVRAVCSEISLDPDPVGDSGSVDFHRAMGMLLGGLAVTR